MLGKLFQVVEDVVKLPVAVVKDVVTLGGSMTSQSSCYTQQKLDDLKDDLEELL